MTTSMRLLLVIILPAILVVLAALWFTRNEIFAARDAVTTREERAVIMTLVEGARIAHLEENAQAIANQQADDMIMINRGAIERVSRQQTLERFEAYFAEVDFADARWKTPPTVRILPGGLAAVSTASVRNIYEATEEAPARYWDFAWSTLWEKRDGQWQRVLITSTDGASGPWPIVELEDEGADDGTE